MVEIKAAESPKPHTKLQSQSRDPAGLHSPRLRLDLSQAADSQLEKEKTSTCPTSRDQTPRPASQLEEEKTSACRTSGNRSEGWFDEGEDPCEDVESPQDPSTALIGEEPCQAVPPKAKRKRRRGVRSPSRSLERSVNAWLSKRSVDSERAKSEDFADSLRCSVSPTRRTPRTSQPSIFCRVRPTNIEPSMQAFFASNCKTAPQFTYTYDNEYVAKNFEENSKCCSELLPEALRILEQVQKQHGGPDAFMQRIYGGEKLTPEQLREKAEDYLQEHSILQRVNIVVQDEMLCAASVLKPAFSDERYTLNLASQPTSCRMVQGICDHEIGTHLLRMINDELQVWHRDRYRYKLGNPWVTEEGFATLNTYLSMPCKLLYPQALRYYACCRGAQVGFVQLFSELHRHVHDRVRCWQLCCRIKRGLRDTSQPGAFCMDQAYFKGAVEILRHLDEVDFRRLYAGQLAFQDIDKVEFLMRQGGVTLPKFLDTEEKLEAYKAHCRKLICENNIEASVNYVSEPKYLSPGKEKEILRGSASSPTRARSVPAGGRRKGNKDGEGAAKTAYRSEPARKMQEAEQSSAASETKPSARDARPRGRNAATSSQNARESLQRSRSSTSLVVRPPSASRRSSSVIRSSARQENISHKASPTRAVSRNRAQGMGMPCEGAPEVADKLSDALGGNSSPSRPPRKLQRAGSRGKLTKSSHERLSNLADDVCAAMGSFLSESLEAHAAGSFPNIEASLNSLSNSGKLADDAGTAQDRKGLRCASAGCPFLVNSDIEIGGYCCRKCHASGISNPSHGNKCEQIAAPTNALVADASWLPRKSSSRGRSRASVADKQAFTAERSCSAARDIELADACSGCCAGTHSLPCEGLPAPSAAPELGSATDSTADNIVGNGNAQDSAADAAPADLKPQSGEIAAEVAEDESIAAQAGSNRTHSSKCEGIWAAEDLPVAHPDWLPRKARKSSCDIDSFSGLAALRENWKCASPGCPFVIHRKAKYGGYCCNKCYG